MIRRFLIIIPEFPIDRKSVKEGSNPPLVVTASRCINVGLFLSHDLRRDVEIGMAFGTLDDLRIISFPGNSLQRVSPDERSISFFLLKANEIAKDLIPSTQERMDNGITIKRTSFDSLIDSWEPNKIYLAIKTPQQPKTYPNLAEGSLFVYSSNKKLQLDIGKSETLSRPSSPERFILDVNYHFDSQE